MRGEAIAVSLFVDIFVKLDKCNKQACLGEGRERVKGKRLVVIVREAETKREEIVGCSTKME